jgi:ferredoxin
MVKLILTVSAEKGKNVCAHACVDVFDSDSEVGLVFRLKDKVKMMDGNKM